MNVFEVEQMNFESHYIYRGKDFRCLYAPPIASPMHTHTDFYEFSLITKGSWINVYGGKRRILQKNTLIFFRCHETHAMYINEPDSWHLTFIVTKSFFESFCQQHFADHPEITRSPYTEVMLSHESAEHLIAIADHWLQPSDSEQTDLCKLFLYNALHESFLSTQLSKPIETDLNTDLNRHIKDMLYHFDQFDYLQTEISDIYRTYPASQSTLINQFKKYTGYSIVQYRHLKRMEYAAHMLSVRHCSVSDVANAIGISSISYFSKKFKEHYGLLPKEYQRRSVNPRVDWSENAENNDSHTL